MIFKSKKNKDNRIEEITSILFPPLETKSYISNGGKEEKYSIDYSVDSNLDGALIDLIDGRNDEVVHKTISKAIEKLGKVRKILEAYQEIDYDSKYIIIDNGEDDINAENIEPIENR